MKSALRFVATFGLLLGTTAFAAKMGGVEVPETLTVDGASLMLNGSGTRTKFGFTMYVASLYLRQKTGDATEILSSPDAKAVRLHIVSTMITPARMEEAVREGIANATGGQVAGVQGELDAFLKVFGTGIKPGDIYEFIASTQSGTLVKKNGAAVAAIPGDAFRKALFGIWLCGKPAQESLKKGLLGL